MIAYWLSLENCEALEWRGMNVEAIGHGVRGSILGKFTRV
jgi:hypothetical protein